MILTWFFFLIYDPLTDQCDANQFPTVKQDKMRGGCIAKDFARLVID
jgi:hypothetical protein